MKSIHVVTLFALLGTAQVLSALPICPNTVSTNTDCAFIITIGAGGVFSGAPVAGANPYDGSDDTLVGVINNSGAIFTGLIHLTSASSIFGFDGDGICTFTGAAYCPGAATGYEGPISTFKNVNGSGTAGDISITGLAASGTTFFSLEGSPNVISGGGGPLGSPEPASLALLGSGLLGLFLARRRKQ